MKLKNKYIIGTHIMFYEVDMVEEHIQSLVQCVNEVENKENITIDLFFNLSQYFEELDTKLINEDDIIEKFIRYPAMLENAGCKVTYTIYDDMKPLAMVDYRRDLNYNGCKENDFVIWGESDCLFPKQFFHALETLKEYTNGQNIHRYIATFAIRKMWDSFWTQLEHVDFTDKPYYDLKTDKRAYTEPYSIRYTMSIEEMNEINEKYDNYDIRLLTKPQFDGSCLILTSDLIKNGVNIPHCVIGHAVDDTSIMKACEIIMKDNYKQFVFKNVLKVHNRDHPDKRKYIKGEKSGDLQDQIKDYTNDPQVRRGQQSWYNKLKDMCHQNFGTFGSYQNKFYTYNDFNKWKND